MHFLLFEIKESIKMILIYLGLGKKASRLIWNFWLWYGSLSCSYKLCIIWFIYIQWFGQAKYKLSFCLRYYFHLSDLLEWDVFCLSEISIFSSSIFGSSWQIHHIQVSNPITSISIPFNLILSCGTSGGFHKIMRISYSKCRIKIIYPILSVQLSAMSITYKFYFFW